MKQCVLILVLLFGLVSTHSVGAPIDSIGARSCGQWVEARTTCQNVSAEAWLVGFLSGLADGMNKNFLVDADADSLFLWVDNYCKANPLDYTTTAGQKLAVTLMKRRGIKWP
jgi:hypothetical protein